MADHAGAGIAQRADAGWRGADHFPSNLRHHGRFTGFGSNQRAFNPHKSSFARAVPHS